MECAAPPAPPPPSPRMARERATVRAMVGMSCRARHGSRGVLCPDCGELWAYIEVRLLKCPFRPEKPTCAACPVHCYRQDMRERVREVMRWAGPRMTWRHPWLALRHALDGRATGRPGCPGTASPGPVPSRTPPP